MVIHEAHEDHKVHEGRIRRKPALFLLQPVLSKHTSFLQGISRKREPFERKRESSGEWGLSGCEPPYHSSSAGFALSRFRVSLQENGALPARPGRLYVPSVSSM